MLDGLQYVIAQIAVIVAVAALLAGILGWLINRASRKRRAVRAKAASPASRLTSAPARAAHAYVPRHSIEAESDVPVPVAEEVVALLAPTPIVDEQMGEPVVEQMAPDTLTQPAVAPASDVDDDDPDRTVLRPAPGMTSPSKTAECSPPRFTVVASTLNENEPVGRTASVKEVEELRRDLRAKELELGKLEAGALSAWDRTVPQLEAQVSDLVDENALLRRQIREAEERSDADSQTVERLRSLVAERDSRLAEIRAQADQVASSLVTLNAAVTSASVSAAAASASSAVRSRS